ncbi:MAG: DUF1614 domain-containing protein [Methylocella sp.]
MRYVIPVVVERPGTVIAVNVGGAVIPTLMSLYLLAKSQLWVRGVLAIAGSDAGRAARRAVSVHARRLGRHRAAPAPGCSPFKRPRRPSARP